MPAELLESTLADTAGCTHCEYDQLRFKALSSQQTYQRQRLIREVDCITWHSMPRPHRGQPYSALLSSITQHVIT